MKELNVKAKDNHGHVYDVIVFYHAEDEVPAHDAVLKIVNTPGSWYISTLRDSTVDKVISLDWDQNWNIINFDEIKQELNELGFNL